MKRILCLILVCVFCLSLASCSKSDDKNATSGSSVEFAVSKLKDKWAEEYKKSGVEDQYLEIKNTRVITVKENDSKYFADIDKIVEFMLLANYYDLKPAFYTEPYSYEDVIFYRDGHSEVYMTDYFGRVRGATYERDFTDVIESIEDLGDAHNAVYHLEKGGDAEKAETSSARTETADKAVELLKDQWTSVYHNESYPIDDGYLEIKNTRVITVKENGNEYFKDIDKIVDFMLLDHYLNMEPSFYSDSGMNHTVIFYRDGHTEVSKSDYINLVRGKTYETDYSDVIESIEDLGSTYNAVYHL